MGRIIVRARTMNIIDPASLNCSLLLLPDYAGGTWTSHASAGTSGAKTASSASPPSASSGVAVFDGISQFLTLSGTGADYHDNATYTIIGVGRPHRPLAVATGSVTNDPGLLSDNGGAYGLNITNEGVSPFVQLVGPLRNVVSLFPTTDQTYLFNARFTGGVLSAEVVGSSSESRADVGGPNIMDPAFRTLKLGANHTGMVFLGIDLAAFIISPLYLDDTTVTGVNNWLRANT